MASSISTDNTLLTSLVSVWLTDESGLLTDLHGVNDLTNVNTVVEAPGKQGSGADFEESTSQRLEITDANQTGLDIVGDISIAGWVNVEQLASTIGSPVILADKYRTATPFNGYRIIYDNSPTDVLRFDFSTGSVSTIETDAAFFVSGDVGNWVHFAIAVDVSAATAVFYKNGAVVASTTDASGSTAITDNTEPFVLGSSSSGNNEFDGILNQMCVWSKILSAAEVTSLYNSGAGIPYFSQAIDIKNDADLPTSLVSVWLGDNSGLTGDLHGANTLTDNSVVLSVGKQGDAGDFENLDDNYLSITDANQTGLDIVTDFSVSAWVNFEETPGNLGLKGDIVNRYDRVSANNKGYKFFVDNSPNNSLAVEYSDTGGRTAIDTDTYSFSNGDRGTFVHVAVSVDISAQTAVFYRNGVVQPSAALATGSTSIESNTTDLWIGRNPTGATQNTIDGDLNQICLWSRQISPGEVLSLYKSGAGIPYNYVFIPGITMS